MAISGTYAVEVAGKVPVVGGLVSTGASIYDAVSHFFGGGSPPPFKNIWASVPFTPGSRDVTRNFIRLNGGHGTWTDLITGERMDDKGSDVRKVAVVASGMDMYVDANLRMFFPDGRNVEPNDSWNAWLSRYGNVSFAQAYAAHPNAFRVYGSAPGNDPVIGRMPTPAATTPALPISFAPTTTPAAPDTAFTVAPSNPAPTAVTPTAAPAAAVAPPAPWYNTPLGIAGLVVGVVLVIRMTRRG